MNQGYTPDDLESLRQSVRFAPRTIRIVLLAVAVVCAVVGVFNLWLAHAWSRFDGLSVGAALRALREPTDPHRMYTGAQVLMVERFGLAVWQLLIFVLLLSSAIIIPRRIARDRRIYRSLLDPESHSGEVGKAK